MSRAAQPVEVALIKRWGASALSALFRTPVLVLETTGRRTGRTRQTPLAYHRLNEQSVVVVGGAAGQVRVPDWVANLRAQPDARVTINRLSSDVRARELQGSERAEMWSEVVKIWPRIKVYERRAGRSAPLFLLAHTALPSADGQSHIS